MKQPLDHIERPRLPWRSPHEPAMTECGYDASKVKTLSREAFAARLRDYGIQRAGLVTCMTCIQTFQRHPDWEQEPRLALAREINWEVQWWTPSIGARETNGCRLRDELLALARLAQTHPEAFEQYLCEIRARREWVARKSTGERGQ